MSWYQFSEVIDGYVRSKTGDKAEGLSPAEENELGALLAAPL